MEAISLLKSPPDPPIGKTAWVTAWNEIEPLLMCYLKLVGIALLEITIELVIQYFCNQTKIKNKNGSLFCIFSCHLKKVHKNIFQGMQFTSSQKNFAAQKKSVIFWDKICQDYFDFFVLLVIECMSNRQ